MEDSLTDSLLLEELHRGDEAAAAAVFERYFERLIALARSRLSPRVAARIDPDDVVLSAYRSFFVRARAGAFEVSEGRDLWRLLVEITLHKLYRQTARHLAQRRSPRRETCDESGAPAVAASREPSPEAVAAVADELAAVRDALSAEVCEAFELRLQGYELEEIATAMHTTKAVIRRRLDQAKRELRTRFPAAERAAPTKPKQPRRRPQPRALASLPAESLLDFSEYRLLRQIGSGASGKVYRAIVQPGGELVAVKFMRRSLLHRADYVERFLREAQLVESLRHEGIIRIRGLGRTPKRGFFLAMEFHERGDLQSQINSWGRLPACRTKGDWQAGSNSWGRLPACRIREDWQAGSLPYESADALRWVHQAALAMEHAHRRGIVHCDLKPSNLLLADDGRVVVSDFGLARSLADAASADIAGTPAYLAPEQLDTKWGAIGPATDVYGLGAVLLALLTGHPPRRGNASEVLAAVAHGDPITIPDEVPCRELLTRCLAMHPADRIQTMAAFAEAVSG